MSSKKKSWSSAFTSLFVEMDEPATSSSDEVDIEALLRETSAMTASEPAAPSPRTPTPAATPSVVASPPSSALVLGQPLNELFALYEVPASPKTVEEIAMFLEGLKGMPQNVQHQALKAMDDADPNWTLADVVLDGRYKLDAIGKAKAAVDDQLAVLATENAAKSQQQDEYVEQATQTIRDQITSLREQITELEELLAAETSQVAEQRAADQQRALQLQADATQEHTRLDAEAVRIKRIVDAFSPLAQEP